MSFIEIVLISIGLAMDAFAVSICKGLNMKKLNYSKGLIIAFLFGFFQFLMPTIGYYLGIQFEKYIKNIDHWIIFILLAFIGIKMIIESLTNDEYLTKTKQKNEIVDILILSIATSIDALAVGVTFAFLNVNLFFSSLTIGLITFGLSFLGVILGNYFGKKFKKPAEILGGVILIIIGLKVLLQHLGALPF